MVTAPTSCPPVRRQPILAKVEEPLRLGSAPVTARVVVSATTLGLGGVHTHLRLLCELLRRENIPVDLFATGSDWPEASISSLKRDGVAFHLPPKRLRGARKLASLYSALSWPILMPRRANSVYCIGAGRSHFLMHRLRPPGATSINHEIVEPPGPGSLAAACAARLEATVANSRKVAQNIRLLLPNKRIEVIPFLTSDQPMPAPAPRQAVGGRPLRVTYLGRLVEQKRPDELVRSWRRLTASPLLAGAELDVYGYDPDGRMTPVLHTLVSGSGMEKQIRIQGEYKRSDLPGILRKTDLLVLPSLWEGLPLVLVEAMQHGVPFVATAAGGTEELGESNSDVIVTSTEWTDFETGLLAMASKIRCGVIESRRLHRWAEDRYGFVFVSKQWLECLVAPQSFFNLDD